MQFRKKERLYVSDLVDDPAVTYPAWYVLSAPMLKNEFLHDALIALHTCTFTHYETPASHETLFEAVTQGRFAIYKERYVVGYFGGKLMYLESQGWKSMTVTQEIFLLHNWLI